MALLGEAELRKWIGVLVVAALGSDTVAEVITESLTRARFAEALAALAGMNSRKASAFLMGLLSHIDAVLNCSMQDAIGQLHLDKEVSDALLGRSNGALGQLSILMDRYYSGDFIAAVAIANRLRIPVSEIRSAYVDAVEWADEASRINA
jgi:EAL and modified HD-GYP domain-containing signal transduction protein